jgi:hypothetical protein
MPIERCATGHRCARQARSGHCPLNPSAPDAAADSGSGGSFGRPAVFLPCRTGRSGAHEPRAGLGLANLHREQARNRHALAYRSRNMRRWAASEPTPVPAPLSAARRGRGEHDTRAAGDSINWTSGRTTAKPTRSARTRPGGSFTGSRGPASYPGAPCAAPSATCTSGSALNGPCGGSNGATGHDVQGAKPAEVLGARPFSSRT